MFLQRKAAANATVISTSQLRELKRAQDQQPLYIPAYNPGSESKAGPLQAYAVPPALSATTPALFPFALHTS